MYKIRNRSGGNLLVGKVELGLHEEMDVPDLTPLMESLISRNMLGYKIVRDVPKVMENIVKEDTIIIDIPSEPVGEIVEPKKERYTDKKSSKNLTK